MKRLRYDRYKFVCTCSIGREDNGNNLQQCSRSCWNTSTDSYITYTYSHSRIFCTVTVFAVYHEWNRHDCLIDSFAILIFWFSGKWVYKIPPFYSWNTTNMKLKSARFLIFVCHGHILPNPDYSASSPCSQYTTNRIDDIHNIYTITIRITTCMNSCLWWKNN